MKATDLMQRPNFRQLRARQLTAEIMQIVQKNARDEYYDTLRDIQHELEDLFVKNGIEILTDSIRQEMRLPARGPDGWTDEEIAAYDRRRLNAMMRPITVIIPKADLESN